MKIIRNMMSAAAVLMCAAAACTPQEDIWSVEDAAFVTKVDMGQQPGDMLTVLDGFDNLPYKVESVGALTTFVGEGGLDANATDVFAVFPYDGSASRYDMSVIFSVPSVQNAVKDGIDRNADRYAAYSSNLVGNTELAFVPMVSYLRLRFDGSDNIRSVVFKSMTEEFITGTVKATLTDLENPYIVFIDGSDNLTLTSESVLDGYYTIALVPSVLQNGLEIRMTNASGQSVTKKMICRDENGVVSAMQLIRGKVNRYDIGFDSVELEWESNLVVNTDKVFWSDARICWTDQSETKPDAYRIMLDGNLVGEVTGTESEYHVTGLPNGYSGQLIVSSVSDDAIVTTSRVVEIKTGTITQLTRNVSPTSVSFNVENMTGSEPSANGPALEVELYDGPDVETATKVFAADVVNTHVYMSASFGGATPFMPTVYVSEDSGCPPLNMTVGGLKPDTPYWVRVRCHESLESVYAGTSKTFAVNSAAGSSEFSSLQEIRTAPAHQPSEKEILFQGFDEFQSHYDFMNTAVGTVPTQYFTSVDNSLGLTVISGWDKEWCFTPLRKISQLVNIGNGLTTKETKTTIFEGDPAPVAANTKRYVFMDDECESLAGWWTTTRTYICPGYISLGQYFTTSNGKGTKYAAYISTPELPAEDGKLSKEVASDCVLSYKALALVGQACEFEIWVRSESVWTRTHTEKLFNSSGTTETVSEWSSLSDGHKWYDYSCDISLRAGDMVAFVCPAGAEVILDDICISLK